MTENQDMFKVAELVSSLARAAQAEKDKKNEPTIVEVHDRKYLYRNGQLEEIEIPDPLPEYYPDEFIASTLDGLIEWIKADTDKLFDYEKPKALVVVTSPTRVVVLSNAQGAEKRRIQYARCTYEAPQIPFDQYNDSEYWNAKLQSCFLKDDCRDIVLKIVNNMTEEQSVKTADDGISQRVTVTAGVQGIDTSVFQNPAWLRPMRTFPEVTQPVSPFVVRFKEGKQTALLEADGGKWKVEAIQTVGKYLSEKLALANVVVIA